MLGLTLECGSHPVAAIQERGAVKEAVHTFDQTGGRGAVGQAAVGRLGKVGKALLTPRPE
jgi:hypothetical protein